MHKHRKKIGLEVERLRKLSGISKTKLYELAPINRTTYTAIITGNNTYYIDSLLRVLKVFGASLNDINLK